MLAKFKSHIAQWNFGNGTTKLLVACSGGLDSVVLAHLCKKARLNFALAHCNFNLRGEESDGDQWFVEALSKELGCELFVASFDTERHAEEFGGSIQMAARELRYKWFEGLREEKSVDFVLTAHHADDDLETFLINLSRGTGIEGLTGIPERNEHILRPLLPFARKEIHSYAKSEALRWREDSSNKETKYLRNKIRLQVIPELKGLHPEFLQNFKNTQKRLLASQRQLSAFKEHLTESLFEVVDDVIRISLKELNSYNPDSHFMYLLLSEFGFTSWDDVLNLLTASSGKEVVSATHKLVKDRNSLLLVHIQNTAATFYTIESAVERISNPVSLTFEKVEALGAFDAQTIYVDGDKLKYPLILRRWQEGDWFYPFGMKGKKKVSKFFKDEKLDVVSKSKKWLLCSENTVVWIVGMRADNRFAVTASTKDILRITYVP